MNPHHCPQPRDEDYSNALPRYDMKGTSMKATELIPSKYLRQEDLNDEETVVTVASLKKVNVAQEDEPPEYKWTIKFQEFERPLVLNSTNIKRLSKALGDDTESWLGGQVKLYVDHDVEFGGKVVGGIRVRALTRKGTAAKTTGDDDVNAKLRATETDDSVPF